MWSKQLWLLSKLTPENIWFSGIRVTVRTFRDTVVQYDERQKKNVPKTITTKRPVLQVSGYIVPDKAGNTWIDPLTKATQNDPEFSAMFEVRDWKLDYVDFNGYPVRSFRTGILGQDGSEPRMMEFLKGKVTPIDWIMSVGIVVLAGVLMAGFVFLVLRPRKVEIAAIQEEKPRLCGPTWTRPRSCRRTSTNCGANSGRCKAAGGRVQQPASRGTRDSLGIEDFRTNRGRDRTSGQSREFAPSVGFAQRDHSFQG